LRPDFILCRSHSQHQVGSPVDFSYAAFLLPPTGLHSKMQFLFPFLATGLHFQAARLKRSSTTTDFSWSGPCSVLSSGSRITVSGACNNQLKVNAIAAAAFWSLHALLDFLRIWFSLPLAASVSGCAQLVVEAGLALESPDHKARVFFLVLLAFSEVFLITSARYSIKCLRGRKCCREGSCFGFLMCLHLVVLLL
jgi:hypothetical protein